MHEFLVAVQEVINSYLVAHSARDTSKRERENVYELNSHDVICFINSIREKY